MAEEGRRLALLIGVGAYAGMPPLRQPVADAAALKDVLETHGGFTCTVLPDPDFVRMRQAVINHFEELRPPDTGLLFFSGHGVKHGGGLYLCPTDMEPKRPANRGLHGDEIRHRIADPGGARTHVIMLDCCYAGAITSKGGDEPPLPREAFDPEGVSGVVYFAATDPKTPAPSEWKGGTEATSPYTSLLLEGLGGGAGGDKGWITAPDLAAFLATASRERRLDLEPAYSANHLVRGDIRLTRNPLPGWGRLPSWIHDALDAPDAPTRVGAYYELSRYAADGSAPERARVADKVLHDRVVSESLRDGRVSEAIRTMLGGLDGARKLQDTHARLQAADADRAMLKAEVARLDDVAMQASISELQAARAELITRETELRDLAAQCDALRAELTAIQQQANAIESQPPRPSSPPRPRHWTDASAVKVGEGALAAALVFSAVYFGVLAPQASDRLVIEQNEREGVTVQRDHMTRSRDAVLALLAATPPATNVAPNGKRWADIPACRPYLNSTPQAWRAPWREYVSGMASVYVYSSGDLDENDMNIVRDRFIQAYPGLSFTNDGAEFGLIHTVLGTNLSPDDAQVLCAFARTCVSADSTAWVSSGFNNRICPPQ